MQQAESRAAAAQAQAMKSQSEAKVEAENAQQQETRAKDAEAKAALTEKQSQQSIADIRAESDTKGKAQLANFQKQLAQFHSEQQQVLQERDTAKKAETI